MKKLKHKYCEFGFTHCSATAMLYFNLKKLKRPWEEVTCPRCLALRK